MHPNKPFISFDLEKLKVVIANQEKDTYFNQISLYGIVLPD